MQIWWWLNQGLNVVKFNLKKGIMSENDFCKYFMMKMSKNGKKEKKGLNFRVRKISQMLMVIATFVDLDWEIIQIGVIVEQCSAEVNTFQDRRKV